MNEEDIKKFLKAMAESIDSKCIDAKPEADYDIYNNRNFYGYNYEVPNITMEKYLQRFHKIFSDLYLANEAYEKELPIKFLILAMNFIDRFMKVNPGFNLTKLNCHRLVCVAVLEANKILADEGVAQKDFAIMGGVDLELLNALEGDFCNKMKFNFKMDSDEFAAKAMSLGLNEEQVAKILAVDANGMSPLDSPVHSPKKQTLTTNTAEQLPENSIKSLILNCFNACFKPKKSIQKFTDNEPESSGSTSSFSSDNSTKSNKSRDL